MVLGFWVALFRGGTRLTWASIVKQDVTRALAAEALVDFELNHLKCHHIELIDRYMVPEDYKHLGFETSMFDSFELDISRTEDELWRNLRHDCKTIH